MLGQSILAEGEILINKNQVTLGLLNSPRSGSVITFHGVRKIAMGIM